MSSDLSSVRVEVGPLDGKQRTVCTIFGDLMHTDRFDVRVDGKRSTFIERAETRFGMRSGDLEFLHEEIVQAADRTDEEIREQADRIAQDETDLLAEMSPVAKRSADAFLQNERLVEELRNDIARCGVAGEETTALTLYLIGTSRLLSKPMAGIVQAASSSGKSYVIDRVARMFPSEAVVMATPDDAASALLHGARKPKPQIRCCRRT